MKEQQIAAIGDDDARENYRVMLRFRDQLLAAPSLEAFYCGLFQHDVAVPPLFVDQTVQAILRGILDGDDDGLKARAAELFSVGSASTSTTARSGSPTTRRWRCTPPAAPSAVSAS